MALGNRRIGLFLPYTPLHHLLLAAVGRPIVLTSGNLSDEPLAIDDADAAERLAGIADAFLVHDRRIRARYDNSVTRVVGAGTAAGARESIIRRGRGTAPEPLALPVAMPAGIGRARDRRRAQAHLRARGRRAGRTSRRTRATWRTSRMHQAYEGNRLHLQRLLALEPTWAFHDLHPGYLSTQDAVRRFPAERRIGIQHHHAHVASCAAEHGVRGPFLGVAYDGLGMGDDGTFWGGEVLLADLTGYRRVARFGRAPMPGGAAAVKRPYRMALGYLFAAEGAPGPWESAVGDGIADAFLARLDPREVEVVRLQLARRLNAPVASSAGRLFDAASSLLGLRDVAEFEAQAAIDLEMAADPAERGTLPWHIERQRRPAGARPAADAAGAARGPGRRDPRRDPRRALPGHHRRRHARAPRRAPCRPRAPTSCACRVACSRMRGSRTRCSTASPATASRVHINERVPVNDGGISYGQAAIGAARLGALAGQGS